MRTAYAIHHAETGPALLVFRSKEARNAFCTRTIFKQEKARAISGNEARKLYGSVPSHDACRANLTDDPCCNFHVLPIPAGGIA